MRTRKYWVQILIYVVVATLLSTVIYRVFAQELRAVQVATHTVVVPRSTASAVTLETTMDTMNYFVGSDVFAQYLRDYLQDHAVSAQLWERNSLRIQYPSQNMMIFSAQGVTPDNARAVVAGGVSAYARILNRYYDTHEEYVLRVVDTERVTSVTRFAWLVALGSYVSGFLLTALIFVGVFFVLRTQRFVSPAISYNASQTASEFAQNIYHDDILLSAQQEVVPQSDVDYMREVYADYDQQIVHAMQNPSPSLDDGVDTQCVEDHIESTYSVPAGAPPVNLPLADEDNNDYSVAEDLVRSDQAETIKSTNDNKSAQSVPTKHPTPEEAKRRLNELLRGNTSFINK